MDKASVKIAVRQLRDKVVRQPEYFFEEIVRTPMMPWQLKGINAIIDVRRAQMGLPTVVNHKALQRISAVSGHGTGKTHWLAGVAHLWNFVTYGLIAITAPKQDQIKTRFFYRYKRILNNSVDWYREAIQTNVMNACIGGDETWGIQGETASDPSNLAGYHDTPQLFLVDEAGSKNLDPMYPVVEGALSTPGSILAEIGNPTRVVGALASHHLRRGIRDLYYRMHVGPEDAPQLVDPKWVEHMKQQYGEDSPIYKVRVLGLFVDVGDNQLIALSWLNEARDSGELFEPDGSIPQLRVAGDVADGGADSSVITTGYKYDSGLFVKSKQKHNFAASESPIKVAQEMIKVFEREGGDKGRDVMIVDSIGVGAGTAGYLIEKGFIVVCFVGGATSANPKRFRNRRVQGYISLRDYLRDGRIFYGSDFVTNDDDWDEYCKQLVGIQTKLGTERVEDLETKDEYKAREGKSPDEADSTMMLCAPDIPQIAQNQELNFETFGQMEAAGANW